MDTRIYLLGVSVLIVIGAFLIIKRRKLAPKRETKATVSPELPKKPITVGIVEKQVKRSSDCAVWYKLILTEEKESLSLRETWWIRGLKSAGAAIKYISKNEIWVLIDIDPAGLDNLVEKNLINRWELVPD